MGKLTINKRFGFKRLGQFYFVALGCIALSIVISQILIQTSINSQQDDARVINVAGRQRMLSQKISKSALQLHLDETHQSDHLNELSEALDLWMVSHEGLQNGNESLGLGGNPSAQIQRMYRDIAPHYEIIQKNAASLLMSYLDHETSNRLVANILENEDAFLSGMNRIVFQYDYEAQEKVANLKEQEFYLFVISLLIIILEIFLVFAPLARNVRVTVQELTESEKSSQNMAREISKLYEELGKNYQDLEAVNMKPESPTLYASIRPDGTFNHLSSKFLRMMEYEEKAPPHNIVELLEESYYEEDFIKGLQNILKSRKNWTGELRLINEPGDFCWLETHLIPTQQWGEIKLIAKEITEFKEAKIRSREINKERIEKSVKAQQYRSALILQGQEEERKRLSQELHDGVGQMLSAMKLLLESIDPPSQKMKNRLANARSLMKSIIQEVRRVSFNLTPSSLDDFGLVAAITKFCDEIDAVTEAEVAFTNQTRFINRLESNVETNLYRIIQEAVNNALKYSKATKIAVSFSHTINTLSISVKDNGNGFDYARVEKTGHFKKAGHGIFNMKERTSYIGGAFSLHTAIDQGTQITITLPLSNND